MFTDNPQVQVVRFTPAYSHTKCTPWIPLMLSVLCVAAICFAPAYIGTLLQCTGNWMLWAWIGAVFGLVVLIAALTPYPSDDTYIVYTNNKASLEQYQDEWDIEKCIRKNHFCLTRKRGLS